MKTPFNTLIVTGCLLAGSQFAGAAILADYNFAFDATNTAVVNGAAVTPNSLLNEGTAGNGNDVVGPPVYSTYVVPATGIGSNGDGMALKTGPGNGNGSLYFGGVPALSINSNFSVFGRVQFNSLNGFVSLLGRPAGNYFLFVRDNGKLDFFAPGLGDAFAGNAGSPILTTGTWFDVGFSFSGVGNDADADTVKLYVNGVNVATATGVANFGTGDVFHIGANAGGDQTADALFDRVIFYDEVLGDSGFAALSAVPEPSALLLSAAGLSVLGIRRKRN